MLVNVVKMILKSGVVFVIYLSAAIYRICEEKFYKATLNKVQELLAYSMNGFT